MIRIARNISRNLSRNLSKTVGTEPDLVLDSYGGASAAYSLYDLGNKRGTVVETGETVYGDFDLVNGDTNNGNFETAGSGGADVFSYWTESVSGASTIEQDLIVFDTGIASCKLTGDSSNSNVSLQGGSITNGQTIAYEIRCKTDTASRSIKVGGNQNADQVTIQPSAVDEWQTFSGEITIAGGSVALFIKRNNLTDTVFHIDYIKFVELDTYRTLDVAYHNPAVRLRRDSDNIHKSFPAGAFTQMLNWANEEVVLVDATTYNGDFDADTDWVKGTGWSIGSGVASCDGTQAGNTDLYVDGPLVTDTSSYEITYTVSNYSAGQCRAVVGGFKVGTYRSANGTYTETLTTANPSTITRFAIQGNLDFIGDIDDISVTKLTSNAYAATWYDQSSPTPIVQSASENDVASAYETHTPSGINGVTLVNLSSAGKSGFPLNTTVPTGYAVTVQFDAVVNGGQIDTISLRESVASTAARSNTETLSASGSYSWTFTSTLDTAAYLHFATTSTTADVVISNLVITSHIYNDAIQSTAARQPKVVDAGVLVTDANGNYALDLGATTDAWTLGFDASAFDIGSASTFVIGQHNGITNSVALFAPSTYTPSAKRWYAPVVVSGKFYGGYGETTTAVDLGAFDADLHIFTLIASTSFEAWKDGTSGGTATLDSGFQASAGDEIGQVGTGANWAGKVTAIVWYPTDQSANRSGIESVLSNTITTALS